MAVGDFRLERLELAIQLHRQGDLAGAETHYREVLRREPDHAKATHLLGAVLLEQKRNEDAASFLARAVARAPSNAALFANLGEAQRRLGRHVEAIESLHRAISRQPAMAEAHFTMGLVLHTLARHEEALAFYRQAVMRKPALAPAHKMMAEVLSTLERHDEALAAWMRASELDAANPAVHDGAGAALLQLGRIDEAVASFRRALHCDPSFQTAHSRLVYALGLHPEADTRFIAAEAARWRESHAPPPDGYAFENDRTVGRRLRIGYLSPDFRNHSHALFLIPLFEHHDRKTIEVVAYSLVSRPDAYTERVASLADRYCDVASFDDSALVGAIRRDRVDILVDLSMHLAGNRLRALARKAAPVQASWLAYPGTTGLTAIDYRLTDVFLDPPEVEDEGAYSEQSICLPETFWCYAPLTDGSAVSPLPALREGRITFGCLNSFNKMNGTVFGLWSRVLRAVERSRIVLLAWPGESRARALDAFAAHGIEPGRVEFVTYQARSAYFDVFHRIDIGLDTVPHNGGATSLDSFWMGVPVVTLVGHTVVGRAGLSFVSNLGLPELATRSPDEFVAAATALAGDWPYLAELRRGLRATMERSPLMDVGAFAGHMEDAYQRMWRNWCMGSGPPARAS